MVPLNVVELGNKLVRGTVSVGVVDVLVRIRSNAANVWCIGELSLVIVFVVPGFPPTFIFSSEEWHPGFTVHVWQLTYSTKFENTRCKVDVQHGFTNNNVRWNC